MVVVNDTAKYIAACHRTFFTAKLDWYRTLLLNTLMRSRSVVVADVFPHHALQVLLVQDQQTIKTFFPCASHPAFRKRIRLW